MWWELTRHESRGISNTILFHFLLLNRRQKYIVIFFVSLYIYIYILIFNMRLRKIDNFKFPKGIFRIKKRKEKGKVMLGMWIEVYDTRFIGTRRSHFWSVLFFHVSARDLSFPLCRFGYGGGGGVWNLIYRYEAPSPSLIPSDSSAISAAAGIELRAFSLEGSGMEEAKMSHLAMVRAVLSILQWWAFNVTVIIMNKWIFQVWFLCSDSVIFPPFFSSVFFFLRLIHKCISFALSGSEKIRVFSSLLAIGSIPPLRALRLYRVMTLWNLCNYMLLIGVQLHWSMVRKRVLTGSDCITPSSLWIWWFVRGKHGLIKMLG